MGQFTSNCDQSDIGARQIFPQIVERLHELLLVLLRRVLCRFKAGFGAEVVVANENSHQLRVTFQANQDENFCNRVNI